MSEFACSLPRNFISFRILGFETRAHKLAQERQSENPQNFAQIDEVKTVLVGETSNSAGKVTSIMQVAPSRAGSIGARWGMKTMISLWPKKL